MRGRPIFKSYLNSINQFFSDFSDWIIQKRIGVILSLIIITIFFSIQIPNITIDNSLESFFLENDKNLKAYNDFKNDFGSDLFVYIALSSKNPFNIQSIQKLRKLTNAFKDELPYTKGKGVTSIVNVEFMETVGDEFKIYEYMKKMPVSEKEFIKIRNKFLKKPIYINNYISRDGNIYSLLIKIKNTEKERKYKRKIYDKIQEIISRPEYVDFKFHVVGRPVFDTVYARITVREFYKFFSLSIIIMIILLLYIFRNKKYILGTMFVLIITLLWVFGLMAFLGFPLRIISTIIPPLLLSVGVGDTIHIHSEFKKHSKTSSIRDAIRLTMNKTGLPCLLTSLTTAAGFSSLCIADIQPIRETGLLAAFGVISAFLITIFFLPPFLYLLKEENNSNEHKSKGGNALQPASSWETAERIDRFLQSIAMFSNRRRWAVLLVSAAIIIFSIAGLFKLKVETDFLEYFEDGAKIKNDYKFIDKNLGGSVSLQVVIDTGKEGGIKEPEAIREIEKIQNYLNSKSNIIKKTVSVVDFLKDIKNSLNADNPNELPKTREETSQYLLLYEQSGGEEISRYINYLYSKARIDVRYTQLPIEDGIRLQKNIEKYISENIDRKLNVHLTGTNFLSARMVYYMINGQIYSLLMAFVIISILMSFVFASLRIGLLSMIPNILPVLLTLGLMGWTGKPLDFATLLIGCIAIGISVDDTIHFFNRFIIIFRKTGDTTKAVFESVREVGRALFFTSLILTLAYIGMASSSMKNISAFGYLSAFTILVAIIADLMLGPALLLIFKPLEKRKVKRK